MSEVPRYVNNFVNQLTSCLRNLNRTNRTSERFSLLLQLQFQFERLVTDPEGARPHDPPVVSFVDTCRFILDNLFELEIRRFNIYVQHLHLLLRRPNYTQPPED